MIGFKIGLPVFGVWGLLIGSAVVSMAVYDVTPGAGPDVAALIRGPLAPGRKLTLLMFVHPRCPCSVASLEELSELMSRFGKRLDATVLFFQPGSKPAEWSRTESWRDACDISGVVVRADLDAQYARKYGARTSGQVFLFDQSGHLLFEGGITGSRGHAADNPGLQTLSGLIEAPYGGAATIAHAPVFGCAIYSSPPHGDAARANVGKP